MKTQSFFSVFLCFSLCFPCVHCFSVFSWFSADDSRRNINGIGGLTKGFLLWRLYKGIPFVAALQRESFLWRPYKGIPFVAALQKDSFCGGLTDSFYGGLSFLFFLVFSLCFPWFPCFSLFSWFSAGAPSEKIFAALQRDSFCSGITREHNNKKTRSQETRKTVRTNPSQIG